MTPQLQALLDAGFDASREDEEAGHLYPRCSQCDAKCINGTACHEVGCPNRKHECAECETLIPQGYRLCESCANPDDEDGVRTELEPEEKILHWQSMGYTSIKDDKGLIHFWGTSREEIESMIGEKLGGRDRIEREIHLLTAFLEGKTKSSVEAARYA